MQTAINCKCLVLRIEYVFHLTTKRLRRRTLLHAKVSYFALHRQCIHYIAQPSQPTMHERHRKHIEQKRIFKFMATIYPKPGWNATATRSFVRRVKVYNPVYIGIDVHAYIPRGTYHIKIYSMLWLRFGVWRRFKLAGFVSLYFICT